MSDAVPPGDQTWTQPPGAPPPPGWPGPATPSPQSAPQPAGGPPYAWVGAAHKPGAVPLRPLGLTDIYDAAFRIIRFNPRATVGAALLVAAASMALPLLVTGVLTATTGAVLDAGGDAFGGADLAAILGTVGAFGVGVLLNSIGTLLVTGLIVRVCLAAAIGRRVGLGEAWAETRGSRWRLVGLSLGVLALFSLLVGVYAVAWVLVVLADTTVATVVWAIVSIPAFVALMAWVWIRMAYLPVPALMTERLGVIASMRRAFALTRRQFWRTLGIALLTLVITSIAAQVLTTPVTLVLSVVITGLGPEYALLSLVVTQAVATVISAAFVTPFTAAVTSLQYLDQRMRKEAFDVELMQRAGVTAA